MPQAFLLDLCLNNNVGLLLQKNMNALEKLRNLDFANRTPDDVRELLSDLKILCVPFYVKKGTYILRGRRGGGYIKRSQMTYCPVEKCTSMQRASLANQTMFYGVISDNQAHQEDARAVVASECSTLCREGIESIGREVFSIAHWEVIKPLHVVSLINDTTYPDIKDNALLNQLREAFVMFHGGIQSSEKDKEISKFVSSEFCKVVKNDSDYLISATIATDIIKDMNFDGIVYPSVQLGGQGGINIALTTKAVNRKLKFIRTVEQTLYKNGGRTFIRLEKAYGKKLQREQFPDSYIEKELNINSILDLPIVD